MPIAWVDLRQDERGRNPTRRRSAQSGLSRSPIPRRRRSPSGGRVGPRDIAKLLFADFLLIHGDDWYLARLDIPTGSLCWIDFRTRDWYPALECAGLDKRGPYALRHTYATFLLDRGVPILWVARRRGTSIEMIDRHYEHCLTNSDERELEELDHAFRDDLRRVGGRGESETLADGKSAAGRGGSMEPDPGATPGKYQSATHRE